MRSPNERKSPPGSANPKGGRIFSHRHSNLDLVGLKARLTGRYDAFIASVCPSAHNLLARIGNHGPCPLCGGKDRARFFKDVAMTGGFLCHKCAPETLQGLDTVMHLTGWTFGESVREAASWLGLTGVASTWPEKAPYYQLPINRSPEPRAWARANVEKVLAESRPCDHPEAEPLRRYFASRGLDAIALPTTLRYHPSLPYRHEGQIIGNFPAMVALVVDVEGKAVSAHRTYLTPDGRKAEPEWLGARLDPRKLMPAVIEGSTRGAAIRLFKAGPVLAIAEGIETALAYHLLTGLPTWAAVSAGGLESVKVPAMVGQVIIAGDLDAPHETPKGLKYPGQDAANHLAKRLEAEGRVCRIDLPPDLSPGKNTDWNDVLMKEQGVRHVGE